MKNCIRTKTLVAMVAGVAMSLAMSLSIQPEALAVPSFTISTPSYVNVGQTFNVSVGVYIDERLWDWDCESNVYLVFSSNVEPLSISEGNFNSLDPWIENNAAVANSYDCDDGYVSTGSYNFMTVKVRANASGIATANMGWEEAWFDIYGDIYVQGKTFTVYPAYCPSGQLGTPPNCYTPPPPDVCPNIAGAQATIPSGMIKDGSGNCVTPPPPDVCPNIAGAQATIPSGMVKDGSGNCVTPTSSGGSTTPQISSPPNNPAPSPAPISQPAPTPPPVARTAPTTPGVPTPVVTESKPEPAVTLREDGSNSIQSVIVTEYIKSARIQWKAANGLKDVSVLYAKTNEEKKPLDSSLIKQDNGVYSVRLDNLDAYASYEFVISGKNSAGKNVSYSGVVTTHGYPVEVTILSGDAPVSGAKIVIMGYEYTSDQNGKIVLELPVGQVSFDVAYGDFTKSESIEVKDIRIGEDYEASETQKFSLDMGTNSDGGASIPLWLIILPIGVFSLILFLVIFAKKRRNKSSQTWTPLTSSGFTGYVQSSSPPASIPIPASPPSVEQPAAGNIFNSENMAQEASVPDNLSDQAVVTAQSQPDASTVLSDFEPVTETVVTEVSSDAGAIHDVLSDYQVDPGLMSDLQIHHDTSVVSEGRSIPEPPLQAEVAPGAEAVQPQVMMPVDPQPQPQPQSQSTSEIQPQPMPRPQVDFPQVTVDNTQQPAQDTPGQVSDEPEDIFEEANRNNRFANLK